MSPVLGIQKYVLRINTIVYVLITMFYRKYGLNKLCSLKGKFDKVMTITWTVPWNRCYLKEGLLKTPKNECSLVAK